MDCIPPCFFILIGNIMIQHVFCWVTYFSPTQQDICYGIQAAKMRTHEQKLGLNQHKMGLKPTNLQFHEPNAGIERPKSWLLN